LIKYVSGLPVVNIIFNKKEKKTLLLQGAAPNSPNSLQALDLGL